MKTPRIFGVLFGFIAICSLSLALRRGESVLNRPLCDDAFYCFAISHNLAQGNGVTIDGATLTNGFQPLYVFLSVPLFALAGHNQILGVRLVLAFLWLTYLGTGFLLGQIVRTFIDPDEKQDTSWICWMAATVYLSSAIVFLKHFCGLETGCLLFAYAACWRYYQTGLPDTHKRRIVFGSLLGLLVLTRIDAAFFVVIVSVGQLVANRNAGLSLRIARFFEISIPAFLVSSPWWFYNVYAFHSLMPSSGTAEQGWELSVDRFKHVFAALGQNLIPWFYLPNHHADWTIGVLVRSLIILLMVIAAIVIRRAQGRLLDFVTSANESARRALEFAWWVAGSVLILAVWYGLSSRANYFYTRYFIPISLVAAFGAAIVAAITYRKMPKFVTAVILLVVAPTLAGTVLLWHVDSHSMDNLVFREQMGLLEKYVPPNDVVAAGQSGMIGYLRRNVVNLDGKVNAQALGYQLRMWEYLPLVNATWVCDWPSYIHLYLGDHPEKHGWRFVARNGLFDLYRYQGNSTNQEK